MGQNVYTFIGKEGKGRLKFLLFLPAPYGKSPSQKWPVIFFLHGAVERGDDPQILRRHGILRIAEEDPEFPFLVLSPQCPERSSWGRHMKNLKSLLDQILAGYAADPDRIYLTGASMGGNGVWQLASQYPGQFAALAPICGYGLPQQGFPKKVCVLKNTPVWAFHGAQDKIVPLKESQRLVDALKACGGQVRLTIYPDCGHDSWTRTYQDPEIYRWFLRHSLRSA